MKTADEWANEIQSRFIGEKMSFERKVSLIKTCREMQHEAWLQGLDDLVEKFKEPQPAHE